MIVFIESLGRNNNDPDNYFSVVEVVYKENDKALDSFLKEKSEYNLCFSVIAKIDDGTDEIYRALRRSFCRNFRRFQGRSNVFYLDDDLRKFIKGLVGED